MQSNVLVRRDACSNQTFPVDRLSLSYEVLWNAYKKMTSSFSASERADLFYNTAARTYQV
jgi:predicted TIM-barrel fold metal-dependent hydrolase